MLIYLAQSSAANPDLWGPSVWVRIVGRQAGKKLSPSLALRPEDKHASVAGCHREEAGQVCVQILQELDLLTLTATPPVSPNHGAWRALGSKPARGK